MGIEPAIDQPRMMKKGILTQTGKRFAGFDILLLIPEGEAPPEVVVDMFRKALEQMQARQSELTVRELVMMSVERMEN